LLVYAKYSAPCLAPLGMVTKGCHTGVQVGVVRESREGIVSFDMGEGTIIDRKKNVPPLQPPVHRYVAVAYLSSESGR